MNIVCIGITVAERNRACDAFGWGAASRALGV